MARGRGHDPHVADQAPGIFGALIGLFAAWFFFREAYRAHKAGRRGRALKMGAAGALATIAVFYAPRTEGLSVWLPIFAGGACVMIYEFIVAKLKRR